MLPTAAKARLSEVSGFFHAAFVIDAFARRIVGWPVLQGAATGFVLDALEQTLAPHRG